jgi:hypothetical protein
MKIFQFQRFGGQNEQAVTSVRSSSAARPNGPPKVASAARLQLVRTDPSFIFTPKVASAARPQLVRTEHCSLTYK